MPAPAALGRSGTCPTELFVTGEAGVRDSVAFHAAEDEIIDVVMALEFLRGCRTGGERMRQVRCQLAYGSGAIVRGMNQGKIYTRGERLWRNDMR